MIVDRLAPPRPKSIERDGKALVPKGEKTNEEKMLWDGFVVEKR